MLDDLFWGGVRKILFLVVVSFERVRKKLSLFIKDEGRNVAGGGGHKREINGPVYI
jgi:hypothetical protein